MRNSERYKLSPIGSAGLVIDNISQLHFHEKAGEFLEE